MTPGMSTHYVGALESYSVSKLLADLPSDYAKVFENTAKELREALSPRQEDGAERIKECQNVDRSFERHSRIREFGTEEKSTCYCYKMSSL
jgi:hypothetical protein